METALDDEGHLEHPAVVASFVRMALRRHHRRRAAPSCLWRRCGVARTSRVILKLPPE
jgi:hypothetical protein